MDEQILSADRRYRRNLLWLALVLVLVGGAIIFWFQGMIDQIVALAETDPVGAVQRTHWVFTSLMGCFGISLLAFGIYLFQLAARILRSNQMPPPGTRVIRDVQIRTGAQAVRRGRLLLALAVVFALAGTIVPFWMEREFRRAFDIPAIYHQLESPPSMPGIPPQP
jgi:MFS family permease